MAIIIWQNKFGGLRWRENSAPVANRGNARVALKKLYCFHHVNGVEEAKYGRH